MCKQIGKPGQSDTAFVTIQGQRHYLGLWDSAQARERYGALLAEMMSNGGRLAPQQDDALTVTQVIAEYLTFASEYYGEDAGQNVLAIARACKNLKRLYGSSLAKDLRGTHLLAVQASYVADKLTRGGVNRLVNLIRQMVRWAVARDLIPGSVDHALRCVEPLRKGRTVAPDNDPVRPAIWEHVAETMPFLSVPVAGLCWLAWFSGARIGELTPLRACNIDMTGDVWEYRPAKHKGTWRGKDRVIAFGPACQQLIRAFIDRRGVTDTLFSPRDAIQERADRALTHRRPDQRPNARLTDRELADEYDPKVITRSIRRGVELVNKARVARGQEPIPHWHVHQLRHAHATRVRRALGIEAAKAALGHNSIDITAMYAETSLETARQVAGLLG